MTTLQRPVTLQRHFRTICKLRRDLMRAKRILTSNWQDTRFWPPLKITSLRKHTDRTCPLTPTEHCLASAPDQLSRRGQTTMGRLSSASPVSSASRKTWFNTNSEFFPKCSSKTVIVPTWSADSQSLQPSHSELEPNWPSGTLMERAWCRRSRSFPSKRVQLLQEVNSMTIKRHP